MDFILAVKKMMQFFLMKLMERFFPIPPPKPILQRQTTKADGYKNSLSSQYNDDAERLAYVRRSRITGL